MMRKEHITAFKEKALHFSEMIKTKLLAVKKAPDLTADSDHLSAVGHPANIADKASSSSSLLKVLNQSFGSLGEYNFPSEVIGGCCPRVVGNEEEVVWNAAAEACDSERIHLVWQSTEAFIWYIAVRSSDMAASPHSWCPFSSLLPGMKDANPAPVCYTYISEDTATLMAITTDSLHIFRGTGLTIRAKAERMARELGNAPIIELTPDIIMHMTPTPWYSMSLFEDRARRILATLSVAGALVLASLSFIVWLIVSISMVTAQQDLKDIRLRTEGKTLELMRQAEQLGSSPMQEDIAQFLNLNDGLIALNGFLEVYEIKNSKTRWRAVIPPNITADRISQLSGKTIASVPEGIAIGNADQIAYELTAGDRR